MPDQIFILPQITKGKTTTFNLRSYGCRARSLRGKDRARRLGPCPGARSGHGTGTSLPSRLVSEVCLSCCNLLARHTVFVRHARALRGLFLRILTCGRLLASHSMIPWMPTRTAINEKYGEKNRGGSDNPGPLQTVCAHCVLRNGLGKSKRYLVTKPLCPSESSQLAHTDEPRTSPHPSKKTLQGVAAAGASRGALSSSQ